MVIVLHPFARQNLITDDHGPEVVPALANDLRHVYQEKANVGDRQPKVEPPRHLVAAEECRDDMELARFADGQPGQQRARTHKNDAGIGDPLCAVKLAMRWMALAESQ